MIFYIPQQYLDLDSWDPNYGNEYISPSEYFYAYNPTDFILDHKSRRDSPSYSSSSDGCGPHYRASSGSQLRYWAPCGQSGHWVPVYSDSSCSPWSRCGPCNPCYSPICRPQSSHSRSAPPSMGIWRPPSSSSSSCPPWSRSNSCNPSSPCCHWSSPSMSTQGSQDRSSCSRYFPPRSRYDPCNPSSPCYHWSPPSISRQGSQDSSPGSRCFPPRSSCGTCNPHYSPICRPRFSPSMGSLGSSCWSPSSMNKWGFRNPISSCCPPWWRCGSYSPSSPCSCRYPPSMSRRESQNTSSGSRCYPPCPSYDSFNPHYSPFYRPQFCPSVSSWGSSCCHPPCSFPSPLMNRWGSPDSCSRWGPPRCCYPLYNPSY